MYLAKMIEPESDAAIDRIVFDYLKKHLIYGNIMNVERYQGQEVTIFFFGASVLVKYLPQLLLEKWLKMPIETIKQYKMYYLDACLFLLWDCGDTPIS